MNNFKKNTVDFLDKFDVDNVDHLKSFILNVFDGVNNTSDTLGFDARDLTIVNKIRNTDSNN